MLDEEVLIYFCFVNINGKLVTEGEVEVSLKLGSTLSKVSNFVANIHKIPKTYSLKYMHHKHLDLKDKY